MLSMQKIKTNGTTNLRIQFMDRGLCLSLGPQPVVPGDHVNLMVLNTHAGKTSVRPSELWACADLNVPSQLTYFHLKESQRNAIQPPDNGLALLGFVEQTLGLKLLPMTFRGMKLLEPSGVIDDAERGHYAKMIANAEKSCNHVVLPINCVFDYGTFVVMTTCNVVTTGDSRKSSHVIHGAWSDEDRKWLPVPAELFAGLGIEDYSIAVPFEIVEGNYDPKLATCRSRGDFYFNVIPTINQHALVTLPGVYGQLELCGSVPPPQDMDLIHGEKVGSVELVPAVACIATSRRYYYPNLQEGV